mmetsp:Transcript_36580/g.75030  ORF Transcript_36580/g.75030 Transcript_36580/m.75030 type:complete len:362 (-) Transcript_36580:848-1933(-)
MSVSAPSSLPYMMIAMPIAKPRMIFSCCVSCAYAIISSITFSDADPSITKPIASPAASPATALSENSTTRRSSYNSSFPVAIPAKPSPRHAPCWIVSLLALFRRALHRYLRMPSPWLAWIKPRAYNAPPSAYGLEETPACGKYSFMTLREELMQPLCIMPTHAVAENLAQFVARFSHSRFSVMKVSTVVPQCITALANTVAWCVTLLRTSSAPLMLFRISMSVLLLRYKNSKLIPIDVSPLKIWRSFFTREASSFSSSVASGAAGSSGAASFISVSPSPASAAESMSSAIASVSDAFWSMGDGSAARTDWRKCCMSLSHRSNAIWYAMSSCASSPLLTSSLSCAATAFALSRSIKHWQMFW